MECVGGGGGGIAGHYMSDFVSIHHTFTVALNLTGDSRHSEMCCIVINVSRDFCIVSLNLAN